MINLTGFNNHLEDELVPSTYRGGLGFIGGIASIFNLSSEDHHLRAYNECAPLKAIISKRAKSFNNGVIEILNSNTLKPATTSKAKEISRLMKRPNPLQTGKQFMSQQNTYLDLFGYCPVLLVRPFGFTDGITAIWNIPPWLFDIEYTGLWLDQNSIEGIYKGYKLRWASGGKILPKENLKMIFDDGFGTDSDINLTIPDSRLRSLEYPISNIIASYKARNTLITKRGATGILSNGSKDSIGHIPLKEGEKEQLQDDFKRYGIVGQDWQVIISDANLSWQQMGFATKDLMLFEEIEDDIMRICDAFGYPYRLLSSEKSASYNDVREFSKQLYQDTTIPEDSSRKEQLTNALTVEADNIIIKSDFTGTAVLQEDKQQASQARKTKDEALEREFKNNLITLNDWRNEIGLEDINGGDQRYWQLLTAGWTFGTTTNSGATSGDVQAQTSN